MTVLADMTAAGTRILDLLTTSEAALRIGCGPDTVTRLAAAGVLWMPVERRDGDRVCAGCCDEMPHDDDT